MKTRRLIDIIQYPRRLASSRFTAVIATILAFAECSSIRIPTHISRSVSSSRESRLLKVILMPERSWMANAMLNTRLISEKPSVSLRIMAATMVVRCRKLSIWSLCLRSDGLGRRRRMERMASQRALIRS